MTSAYLGLLLRDLFAWKQAENGVCTFDITANFKTIDAAIGAPNGIASLDSTGKVPAAQLPSIGFTPPAVKAIFVDNTRTDSYTPDGSILKPFKTIMAAVNQIAANGDNATVAYSVELAPSTYPETIDLSNPALRNLAFDGNYGAIIGGLSFGQTLVQAIGNDNLTDVVFARMTFTSGSGAAHAMNFSSPTNGTNLGSGAQGNGILFEDCIIRPGGTSDVFINNVGNVGWDRCYITAFINVTNCILALVKGGALNQGAQFNVFTVAGPSPAGFGASQIQTQNATCLATITIDAGLSFIAAMGSRIRNTVTVNGVFTSRASHTSGSIVVNSGGTYKEDGGAGHTGSITLNGTGAYTQTGSYGTGDLFLSGKVHLSTGTGAPNGVVVGSPGDIYLNRSGGAATTLWVKESGAATNTGWVAK